MTRTLPGTVLLMLGAFVAAVSAADPEALQPLTPTAQQRLNEMRNYGGGGGAMILSPDGRSLLTANGNILMVHDLEKPRSARPRDFRPQQPRQIVLEDTNFYNASLAFLPDGKTVVLLSMGNEDPVVQFIDVAQGKPVRQIDNDQQFMCLAASHDGKLLALGGQQKVEIWDSATGNEVRVIQPDAKEMNPNIFFRCVAFSPTSTMLAATGPGNTVQLFEVATGRERQTIRLNVEMPEQPGNYPRRYFNPGEGVITSLAFSADGKLLAVGAVDHSIRIVDLLHGDELAPLVGHGSPLQSLRFTADGKSLLSLDQEGTKLTWNTARIAAQAQTKLPRLNADELDEAWNDLAESDVFRTYRSMRYLSADPERTLPFLEKHLKPIPPGDAARINQLIQDLQNQNGGLRRKAMTEMRKHGEAGLGALMLGGEEARQTQTVQVMIAKLEKQLSSPERQRAIKAVPILEKIGTEGARDLLDKLAKGAAGARLTTDAKAALERLNKRKE